MALTNPPPSTPDEVATSNPLDGLNVNVSMPTPEVRLVNAGALDEYETWFGWASLLGAAAVGFAVPCVQSFKTEADVTLIFVTLVFAGLFGIAARRAVRLRKRIRDESNTYKMRLKSGEGLIPADPPGPER
jgi:hypothetical protein